MAIYFSAGNATAKTANTSHLMSFHQTCDLFPYRRLLQFSGAMWTCGGLGVIKFDTFFLVACLTKTIQAKSPTALRRRNLKVATDLIPDEVLLRS